MGDTSRSARRARRRTSGLEARRLVNDAGLPTVIEPAELSDKRVAGVSAAEVAELEPELAELAARRRVRRRRRRGVVAVLVAVVLVAGWFAFGAVRDVWERSVATRSALAAASEIRGSAAGSAHLPSFDEVAGVGGVAAVVPEVTRQDPDELGEMGYVLTDDGRAAVLVAASRAHCVTVEFSVVSPPKVSATTPRVAACELPELP